MGMSYGSKREALTGVICQEGSNGLFIKSWIGEIFFRGLWSRQKVSGRLNVFPDGCAFV